MVPNVQPQETEVVAKPKRRTFTNAYKRDIVRKADVAKEEPGKLAALLRCEGLYSSHLVAWRRELEQSELAALEPKKRGPRPADPREHELATLRRENAKLTARAERAELIIEIQKKVSLILGVELPKLPEEH